MSHAVLRAPIPDGIASIEALPQLYVEVRYASHNAVS
jgi:hypothetical protein